MSTKQMMEKDSRYVMQTYKRFPVALERGEGARLYDPEGREYIDFTSGIGVNSVGYGHPVWQKAVSEQAAKLGHISNLFYSEPYVELAQVLCARSGMENVYFANSGAEANEGAVKLARKYSFDKYGEGRNVVITLINSFHGRTITTLAATGQEKFHQYFFPFTEGFRHVIAGDLSALESEGGDVCAVMIEMVQGEGGIYPQDKEYVQAVSELCRERDWLLIVDEVQTGIGRTGSLFAYQQYDILPDVVSFAKGIAGGLPLGGVLASPKAKDVFTPGTHATTFGGNPVCCAAGLAVMDILTDDVIAEVAEKGSYIRGAIEGFGSKYITGTRGLGLMIGVAVKDAVPADLAAKLIEAGLLCLTAGSDAIRLLPPLTITYEEIDKGLEIMKKVLCED